MSLSGLGTIPAVSLSDGVVKIGTSEAPKYCFFPSSTLITLSPNSFLPRKAIIYVTSDGKLTYSQGEPAESYPTGSYGKSARMPAPPALEKGQTLIGEIWIPPASSKGTDFLIYAQEPLIETFSFEVVPPKVSTVVMEYWSTESVIYSVPPGHMALLSYLDVRMFMSTHSGQRYMTIRTEKDEKQNRLWPHSASFSPGPFSQWFSVQIIPWTLSAQTDDLRDKTYPMPTTATLYEGEKIIVSASMAAYDKVVCNFAVREFKERWAP